MEKSNPLLFFSDETITKDKCSRLSEDQDLSIAWELVEVSDASPGVVDNDEVLARQIYSPIHLDQNSGHINAAAFTDTFNKGLSVNRLSFDSEEAIHSLGEEKANRDRAGSLDRPPKERNYIGFLKCKSGCIREILENEARVYAIYDTAMPDTPSHADVCCILPAAGSSTTTLSPKAAKKARRESLMKVFGQILRKP